MKLTSICFACSIAYFLNKKQKNSCFKAEISSFFVGFSINSTSYCYDIEAESDINTDEPWIPPG
ncbi:hypothetical protein [uncultured Legionella sp.]|uniref:hypothetical protein n=1 Tax=uncultured Legionella sp. TaxID=210934 RepID=UPI002626A2DF|nr:hypothetical protein [uncultured Legionella sp.]